MRKFKPYPLSSMTLLTALGRSHLNSGIRPNRLTGLWVLASFLKVDQEGSSVVMRDSECRERMKSAHLIKFIQEASSLYAPSAEFVEIWEH